jgi:hypothetical protein
MVAPGLYVKILSLEKMSRRTLYKHLKHGGFLVDAEIWVLTENDFNLMNKAGRRAYKHYRQTRNLKLFIER